MPWLRARRVKWEVMKKRRRRKRRKSVCRERASPRQRRLRDVPVSAAAAPVEMDAVVAEDVAAANGVDVADSTTNANRNPLFPYRESKENHRQPVDDDEMEEEAKGEDEEEEEDFPASPSPPPQPRQENPKKQRARIWPKR